METFPSSYLLSLPSPSVLPQRPDTTAVFVDQSGRRRRLVMTGSITASLLALGLLAVVVGGVFSDPTLSVDGWPGDRPGAVGTASPDRSPRTGPSRRPTPTATQTSARARPSATTSSAPARATRTPSRRPSPTVEPSTQPSAEPGPTTEPATEPTAEPGETTGPPGLTRTPPGLDPDRTKGPKK